MSSWYSLIGFLGGDATSCVLFILLLYDIKRVKIHMELFFSSDSGSLHNICLDSIAAVNILGFPFLDSFPSTWVVSFIENTYIYICVYTYIYVYMCLFIYPSATHI